MNARRKPEDDSQITAPLTVVLVNTEHGLVPIEQVEPGQMIRTPYGMRRIVGTRVREKIPMVSLRLSNGITMRVPHSRQFRSRNTWLEAGALSRGTPVYMSGAPGMFGSRTEMSLEYSNDFYFADAPTLPTAWSIELAELVGYFIAKGFLNYQPNRKPAAAVLICRREDPDLQEYLARIVERIFNKETSFRLTGPTPQLQILSVDIAGAFNQICREQTLINRIPSGILTAPEPIVAGLLRGYIEGDGAMNSKYGFNVPSPHLAMLRDVQQLLTLFGIASTVHKAKGGTDGRRFDYQLRLASQSARVVYNERIGFLSSRKREEFTTYLSTKAETSKGGLLRLPDDFDMIALRPIVYAVWRTKQSTIPDALGSFFKRYVDGCRTITTRRAQWLLDLLPPDTERERAGFLREAIDAAYHEVIVTAIKNSGSDRAVELAIEEESSFIVRGIVVRDISVPIERSSRKKERRDERNGVEGPANGKRVDSVVTSIATKTSFPTGNISCIAAGTLVNTERGLVPVESVTAGEMITVAEGQLRRILAVKAMGADKSVVLKLSNGIVVRCHPAQQLRSGGKWIEAGEISPGAPLYTTFQPGIFGKATALHLHYTTHRPMGVWAKNEVSLPSQWTVELAELVGYVLAHGTFSRKNGIAERTLLTFAPEDEDLIEHFAPIIRRTFGREPVPRRKTSPRLHLFSVDVAGALEQLGAGGNVAHRRIPPGIFTAPEPIVAATLRGYFEGRIQIGAAGNPSQLALNAANPEIAADIQQLLMLFGISSSCVSKLARHQTSKRSITRSDTLYVFGERSKQVFIERIGLISHRRRGLALKLKEYLQTADRFDGRVELLALPSGCDMRGLKQGIVRAQKPASVTPERRRELEEVRQFISAHISSRKSLLTFSRVEWIVGTLPEQIVADHAAFLQEAARRRYVETSVEEVRGEASAEMWGIVVEESGEYLAQGVVMADASKRDN